MNKKILNNLRESISVALSNNLGLKIMAVLFAVFLWWAVVNIDDPIQTKKYIEYSETWLTFFKFLIQLSGDVQICINHVNFRAVVLSAQMVSQLSAS